MRNRFVIEGDYVIVIVKESFKIKINQDGLEIIEEAVDWG